MYLVGLSAAIGGVGSILAYAYNLSKCTNLYALGSYATNFAFIDGVKSTVGMVGVRHRF